MNDYKRIIDLIVELQKEKDLIEKNGALSLERAKQLLVLSECVTAGLHAFLFKHI